MDTPSLYGEFMNTDNVENKESPTDKKASSKKEIKTLIRGYSLRNKSFFVGSCGKVNECNNITPESAGGLDEFKSAIEKAGLNDKLLLKADYYEECEVSDEDGSLKQLYIREVGSGLFNDIIAFSAQSSKQRVENTVPPYPSFMSQYPSPYMGGFGQPFNPFPFASFGEKKESDKDDHSNTFATPMGGFGQPFNMFIPPYGMEEMYNKYQEHKRKQQQHYTNADSVSPKELNDAIVDLMDSVAEINKIIKKFGHDLHALAVHMRGKHP